MLTSIYAPVRIESIYEKLIGVRLWAYSPRGKFPFLCLDGWMVATADGSQR
jgi:hypothetical protein